MIYLVRRTATRLFDLSARRNGPAGIELSEPIKKTIESRRKAILNELAERQAAWLDEEMEKLDNWPMTSVLVRRLI